MNFVNLFLLVSACQGFIFGLIMLFTPFFKNRANIYLAFSTWILSLLMLNVFLYRKGFFNTYPKLDFIDDIEWVFLLPVMLLFYFIHLLDHKLKNNTKMRWLFAPFVYSLLLNLYHDLSIDFKLYEISFANANQILGIAFTAEALGYYSFNIALGIWSLMIIKKDEEKKIQYHWARHLWVAIFSITILWVVLDMIELFIEGADKDITAGVLSITLSCFIFWIFYNGVYRLRIISDRNDISKLFDEHIRLYNPMLISNKTGTSERSLTNNKQKETPDFSRDNIYFKNLESLLQDTQIYKDPQVSREMTAEKLGISSGYLSQIVNTVTNKNFSSYINAFRVEEVKKMISNKEFDRYSLLAIGLEAGFPSKTTFYKAFKKETGYTPSEFKKQYKKVSIS